MITLTPTQQAIIEDGNPALSWLFDVRTLGAVTYRWCTFGRDYGGYTYTAKVLPESFDGVTLNRNGVEAGILAPNDLTFQVSNADTALDPDDFPGATVHIRLVGAAGGSEEVICQWKFRVNDCWKLYGCLYFDCVDFLQQYLTGYCPNTRLVDNIFPSSDPPGDDRVCVPAPFGTAYVPLRSCYIGDAITVRGSTISAVASAAGARCKFVDSANGFGSIEVGRYVVPAGFGTGANNGSFLVLAASAGEIEVPETAGLVDEAAGASVTMSQGSRYYVLGPADKTYTIEKVRSPRDSGAKSEWDSGSYEFRQSTHSDGVDSWRVFQAIVMDYDNDGVPDGNALWRPGDRFLDMPTRFSRSDTVEHYGT